MCGEMAGDIHAVPILLGLGLDAFSMSASAMLKARSVINNLSYSEVQQLANEALEQGSSDEVANLVSKF
jgi:phosphotransferase system enzyme I (PtsI)